jgi:hypothetical protein
MSIAVGMYAFRGSTLPFNSDPMLLELQVWRRLILE